MKNIKVVNIEYHYIEEDPKAKGFEHSYADVAVATGANYFDKEIEEWTDEEVHFDTQILQNYESMEHLRELQKSGQAEFDIVVTEIYE